MIHLTNEKMCNHSTFKIGGIAENVYFPESLEEFKSLFNEEFIVIGNGSNILFSDDVIKTPIIITTKMNNFTIDGERIIAECGTIIIKLAMEAAKVGLSGLEFAGSIPATIGGCVYMNAGAYGGEMADVVESSEVLRENIGLRGISPFTVFTFDNKQHEFGYRKSIFQNTKEIILQTTLKLEKAKSGEITAKMNENLAKRKSAQPIEFPSVGSIFRNNDGVSSGRLIDECGLKGFSIGGAEVSQKHAGFIINKGGATAQNVLDLIEYVKEKVYGQKGIELVEEIKYISS